MSLYDLEMDNSLGMQEQTQQRVFNTCIFKMETLLGTSGNITLFLPVIMKTCANLTRLAKLLYDTSYPFDLDQLAPERVALPLFGIVSPILITFGLLLNCGMLTILIRQRMRTAMGVLLGGMAVVDGMTGVLQLPFFVYAYMLDGHGDYPSMAWCKVYRYVSKLLPTIMHTASVWLAALLAWQRHLGVCGHTNTSCCDTCGTFMTKVFSSCRGTSIAAATCVLGSAILHCLQVIFLHLKEVQLLSKQVLSVSGVDMIHTCSLRLRDPTMEVAYYYIYTWLRLLLAEFLPCLLIGRFNISLVRVTRRSSQYRRSLVHGHRESEKQEAGSARRTTVFLLTLTTTALLTEVVVVVILLVEFVHVATRRSVLSQGVVNYLGVVSNFLVIVTLPVNFFIYTYMGGHMARALKATGCLKLQALFKIRRQNGEENRGQEREREIGGKYMKRQETERQTGRLDTTKQRGEERKEGGDDGNSVEQDSHTEERQICVFTVQMQTSLTADHNDLCAELESGCRRRSGNSLHMETTV